MWSVGTEPYDLYLGSNQGGLHYRGAGIEVASHQDISAAAARWFPKVADSRTSRWRAPAVRLWLSGRLARPVVFEPPQGLRRWSELEQLATTAARVELRTEEQGLLRVLVEAWRGAGPALAVACDVAALEALHGAAKASGVRLASIRPWWAGLLDSGRLPDIARIRMLAARDSDVLTLLSVDPQGAWSSVDTYDPAPETSRIDQLLARRLVAEDLTEADLCRVEMDTSAPGAVSPFWPVRDSRVAS